MFVGTDISLTLTRNSNRKGIKILLLRRGAFQPDLAAFSLIIWGVGSLDSANSVTITNCIK